MKDREFDGKNTGFTLAELLVVIAIIGIATALILPAFTGIGGQSRLAGGSQAVLGAVQMARRHAVAARQPTYLLLQDTLSTADESLAYRSYAVYTIDIHTDAQPVPAEAGEFLTDWEPLPEGIVFDPDASIDDSLSNVFAPSGHAWNGGFNRNRQLRVGNTSYVALGFRPGGLHGTGYDNDLFLCEGFFRNGELIRTSTTGKRIHLDGLGETHVSDTLYSENGTVEELIR